MIQRIQSLFLLAVAVLSGLMMAGDLIILDNGTGTLFSVSFAGLSEVGGKLLQRLWPLTVIIALVPVMALAAIFLYKKRSLQMRVTMLILLLSVGTIVLGAFYVFMFDRKIEVSLIWKAKALFPLVSAILAGLAYRKILQDDLLVKSYDRLR